MTAEIKISPQNVRELRQELIRWSIPSRSDVTFELDEFLTATRKSKNLLTAHLKTFIYIANDSLQRDEDGLTYDDKKATIDDLYNKFLCHPAWQGIGIEAYNEWKLPFVETEEFPTSQNQQESTLKLAKKLGIVGVGVPVIGISVIYCIMQLIDQIKKLQDPNFQLKELQGFHEFVTTHDDSIKLACEIYSGIIAGIILSILLGTFITKRWHEYKDANPIAAERIEDSVSSLRNFCRAIS
jgi:hypothetical protein